MIKAVYLGIDSHNLESGRVYKISTRAINNKLVVSVRNEKRQYPSLEQFLKDWRIKAVCSG